MRDELTAQEARAVQAAYRAPSPLATPVEAILARHIVARAIVVGPLVVAVAWLFGGTRGAASAAGGVVVVVVNFVVSGALMSRAARASLRAYHAAALFGFLVRLVLISLTMLAVAALFDVDRGAMGIGAVVAYLVLLTWEALAVSRDDRKERAWE
ncbi:MAG TPA: hypothetical protein VGC11_02185 [Acidimicrobiia bacterium]|jgi:hypothetical protein